MKECKRCNEVKDLEMFQKDNRLKDGRRNVCKSCKNKRFMEWKTEAGFKEYQKEYLKNNREKIYANNKKWRDDNRDRFNHQYRTRIKNDVQFRLKQYLRNRLNAAIKHDYKSGSAVKDLGCSIVELKYHLESKFKPEMTWENHGERHIDHIIPLDYFNLKIREELLKACHYTNLQPLWASENISKSNNIDILSS